MSTGSVVLSFSDALGVRELQMKASYSILSPLYLGPSRWNKEKTKPKYQLSLHPGQDVRRAGGDGMEKDQRLKHYKHWGSQSERSDSIHWSLSWAT